MRHIDWKNAVIYALFTGLAALVFYWLFGLFAERLGTIEWAILIAATLAAAALVIFLGFRW